MVMTWPHMDYKVNITPSSWSELNSEYELYEQLRKELGAYGKIWRWEYDYKNYTVYFLKEEDKVKFILRWI